METLNQTDSLLRSIWHRYQQYLIPKEIQLSPHQVFFLKFLEQKNTCTPSDISDQFDITLGAVTGFVDRLYKLGLITRERSEDDRRLVLIQLSEEGERRLRIFEKRRAEIHRRILEQLGEEEIELLNQHMAHFGHALYNLMD